MGRRSATVRPGGYHGPVQAIYLLIASGLALLVAVPVAVRAGRHRGVRDPLTQVTMAIAAGAFGAFVVLVLHTDLIPDDLEQTVDPILVIFGTVAVLGIAAYGFRSR